jgi:hypothetical protein
MTFSNTPQLSEDFEQIRDSLPDIYKEAKKMEGMADDLFTQLRHALGVIEAVYLQNPEGFTPVKVEAYAAIIRKLDELGLDYVANQQIMERTASRLILDARLPMSRAGMKNDENKEDRQAM